MGFAALMIYLFHCVPQFFTGKKLLDSTLLWYLKYGTFFGVDLFFLLSGFGLSYSFEHHPIRSMKGYKRYLIRRLVRIYAVYAPALALIALVDRMPPGKFLSELFLIRQFADELYTRLWFIPAIIVFYAAAPLCYRLYEASGRSEASGARSAIRRRKLFTVIMIILTLFVLFAGRTVIRGDLFSMLTRIPCFLVGFLLGYIARMDADPAGEFQTGRASVRESVCGKQPGSKTVLQDFSAALCVITGIGLVLLLDRGKIPEIIPAEDALFSELVGAGTAILLPEFLDRLRQTSFLRAPGKILMAVLRLFGSISLEFYCVQEWTWSKIKPLQLPHGALLNFCICVVLALFLHWIANGIRRLPRMTQPSGSS